MTGPLERAVALLRERRVAEALAELEGSGYRVNVTARESSHGEVLVATVRPPWTRRLFGRERVGTGRAPVVSDAILAALERVTRAGAPPRRSAR